MMRHVSSYIGLHKLFIRPAFDIISYINTSPYYAFFFSVFHRYTSRRCSIRNKYTSGIRVSAKTCEIKSLKPSHRPLRSTSCNAQIIRHRSKQSKAQKQNRANTIFTRNVYTIHTNSTKHA